MSYFRNFDRVVSSHLFTRPNNICLRAEANRVNICWDKDPSIDHLHSCKALSNTINTLRNYRTEMAEGSYSKAIDSELQVLEREFISYKSMVRRYVESGGNITAEGISNIYALSEELDLSRDWLARFVEGFIPSKIQNMNYSNLKDVIEGLKTNSPSSEHLPELSRRIKEQEPLNEQIDYVDRLPNESV